MYRLKENGKVGIVLPDGFLFGNDNTKVNIKKKLLEECNLHTIIRLPGSIFAPYTPIATNLLFFDKTGSTSEVWFYRMDLPKGYKAFSKTKPVEIKHMQSIIEWWNNRIEIEDQKKNESMSVTWKAKKYTIDEIKELNYNLDQCGYPVEEEVILSPKETMDNFIERREKLEADLKDLPFVKKIFASFGNFLLVEFTDGPAVFNAMAQKGVILRSFETKKGLKNCVRISIGSEAELEELMRYLKALEI